MRQTALALALFVLAACGAKPPHQLPTMKQACAFPGTEAGLRAFMRQFVTVPDRGGLTNGMRAVAADYAAVFEPAAAARLETALEQRWHDGLAFAPDIPEERAVITIEKLARDDARLVGVVRDGVDLYCVTFQDRGSPSEPRKLQVVARVGSCWRLFLNPWDHL
jgi:hypothetical protein